MVNPMKNTLIKILLIIAALTMVVSCEKQTEQNILAEGIHAAADSAGKTIAISYSANTKPIDDEPYVENLIHLKNGNVKQLTGFEFGDEFNYNIFEIYGSFGETIYRIKDSKDSRINFLFSEKGNRFNGLISSYEDDFFGIITSVDKLEKIVHVLGEPDEYQRNTQTSETDIAIYIFENAYMQIAVKPDGIIRDIKYIAKENAFKDIDFSNIITEYMIDLQTPHSYSENIYHNAFDGLDQAHYHPYEAGYSEEQKAGFIQNYLSEQGINKDTPVSATYNHSGEPLAEVYIAENNRITFIMHLWGDFWLDYKAGTSFYTNAVYCATIQLGEDTQAGNIIYNIIPENNAITEKLYDAQGKRMANIAYEYISDNPFPFVTDYWNVDSGQVPISEALCRGQKFLFRKDRSTFDESKKLISYNGAIGTSSMVEPLNSSFIFLYAEGNQLETIKENLTEGEMQARLTSRKESNKYLPGEIKFTYKDDTLLNVDYYYSPSGFATTDFSGKIFYDEKGRMLINEYYITHGSHINIFLYEENEQRPWACLYWCSFSNCFESVYVYNKPKELYSRKQY